MDSDNKPTSSIGGPAQHSGIRFHTLDIDRELLRITPDGFFVRGEKLEQDASGARKIFDEMKAWLDRFRPMDNSAAPMPTGTEKAVCEDIARRQALGIAKYGTTVANNPLELKAWLVHQYEELLDAAVYTRRAIAEIDFIQTGLVQLPEEKK